MTAEIDREKFGYLVAHALLQMELTGQVAAALTGCSTRQVSHAKNGKPIDAGATFMLARLCQIDIDELLSSVARDRLEKIQKVQQQFADTVEYQSVTPCVPRETSRHNDSQKVKRTAITKAVKSSPNQSINQKQGLV